MSTSGCNTAERWCQYLDNPTLYYNLYTFSRQTFKMATASRADTDTVVGYIINTLCQKILSKMASWEVSKKAQFCPCSSLCNTFISSVGYE